MYVAEESLDWEGSVLEGRIELGARPYHDSELSANVFAKGKDQKAAQILN